MCVTLGKPSCLLQVSTEPRNLLGCSGCWEMIKNRTVLALGSWYVGVAILSQEGPHLRIYLKAQGREGRSPARVWGRVVQEVGTLHVQRPGASPVVA